MGRNLQGKKPETDGDKKGRKISPSWVPLIFSRRLANLYTMGNEALFYNGQQIFYVISPSRVDRLSIQWATKIYGILNKN